MLFVLVIHILCCFYVYLDYGQFVCHRVSCFVFLCIIWFLFVGEYHCNWSLCDMSFHWYHVTMSVCCHCVLPADWSIDLLTDWLIGCDIDTVSITTSQQLCMFYRLCLTSYSFVCIKLIVSPYYYLVGKQLLLPNSCIIPHQDFVPNKKNELSVSIENWKRVCHIHNHQSETATLWFVH